MPRPHFAGCWFMSHRMTKSYKCKVCHEPYVKTQPMQKVCGWVCAVIEGGKVTAKAKKVKATKERKEDKATKEANKTKPQLTKVAQEAFNAYIRQRDYGKPCICCDKPIAWGSGATGGVCDAGHWLSVGARVNLRFNEDNCHAQLTVCNRHGAGRAVDYRIGLIKRIGVDRVDALESDSDPHKWTHEELIDIRARYVAKRKELEKQE